jgi:hypothetical protein
MYSEWSEMKTRRCDTKNLQRTVKKLKKQRSKSNRSNAKSTIRSGSEVFQDRRLSNRDL